MYIHVSLHRKLKIVLTGVNALLTHPFVHAKFTRNVFMCRKKFEDTKKGLRQAVNQRKTENTVTNRK
jgi:AmiR/NasT family two-component response regulator